MKLESGILKREVREDSNRDWWKADEKGENREGEFIRDMDSLG